MPAPYRQDLRQKAIEAIESGSSFWSVSKSFNVNRNTLSNWYRRYQQTGDYSPKQGYQQGHSHRITDWEAFRAFVREHGEKTQAEMAEAWPGEMSEDAVRRGLKKIGFMRKSGANPRRFAALGNAHQDKRPMPIAKEMSRSDKPS